MGHPTRHYWRAPARARLRRLPLRAPAPERRADMLARERRAVRAADVSALDIAAIAEEVRMWTVVPDVSPTATSTLTESFANLARAVREVFAGW